MRFETTSLLLSFIYLLFFHLENHKSDAFAYRCDPHLMEQVKVVAQDLWKDSGEIPVLESVNSDDDHVLEGEALLVRDVRFSQRAEYFRSQADSGCPKAQHSIGLLLWSGFGGLQRNAEESARFHAAAAYQGHLDGMAVLGGCLRTGSGVKRDVPLGLQLIDYCASYNNPTGVNKKAALLESNQDDYGAVKLYETCLHEKKGNALLLFNLGWCLIRGQGVAKNYDKGIEMWKMATAMAPDEGSEEAAWYLYQEYKREHPKEADKWLKLSEELGYHEGF